LGPRAVAGTSGLNDILANGIRVSVYFAAIVFPC